MSFDILEKLLLQVKSDFSASNNIPSKTKNNLCKTLWPIYRHKLERLHKETLSGALTCRAYAKVVDQFIKHLVFTAGRFYEKRYNSEPEPYTLLAIGGYGREILSPYSDIDLLVLSSTADTNSKNFNHFIEIFNQEVIYPLWDLKLKVNNSVRTISQVIQEAKKDYRTRNAQLEARFLYGSTKLWNQFLKAYTQAQSKLPFGPYCEYLIEDRKKRHEKYNDTPFVQEPEIKYGVGGLRDYQGIFWLSYAYYKIKSLEGLLEQNYISLHEYNELKQAHDFLLKTRNELHFQSVRPTNLLNIEKQPTVAYGLGYTQEDIFERIEAFMRDYYRHTQNIYHLSSLLFERFKPNKITRFALASVFESYKQKPKKYIDGFILKDNVFYADNKKIFEENPLKLIRIFKHCQQFHALLDPNLKTLIRESLHLITHKVIHDPSANKCFCSILESLGEVYPALSSMHELGVLSKFIPEFEKITCLVQHDYYHRYTTDIHTLNCIKVLDAIFASNDAFLKPYAYSIRSTSHPALLYLILLLHDIGKALGIKNHPIYGVNIAKPILKRLQISKKQQNFVLFIIKNHLQMARFWQRFDIDDPEVASSFADFLGNSELLNYLYVETYCDAKATSASFWNSYKEMLHSKLFQKTLIEFNKQKPPIEDQKQEKQEAFQALLKEKHEELAENEIAQIASFHSDRYFTTTSIKEMALHIDMLDQLQARIQKSDCSGSLLPIIHWEEDIDQSLIIVTIITWDRSGLFASLAGAFSATGYSILSAKAFTRKDKITIDTFNLIENENVSSNPETLRKKFTKNLYAILVDDEDPFPEIIEQTKRQNSRTPYSHKTTNPSTPIPPCINLYHELSLNNTILEIQTKDQIGLLYIIAKAISDFGFDITFARITTEHGIANDVFHLQKNNIYETIGTHDLIDLREHINKVLSSQNEYALLS